MIATNTTLARDAVAHLPHADESGRPLGRAAARVRSNRVIAQLRWPLGTDFPIIGVGGVMTRRRRLGQARRGRRPRADLHRLHLPGPELVTRRGARAWPTAIRPATSCRDDGEATRRPLRPDPGCVSQRLRAGGCAASSPVAARCRSSRPTWRGPIRESGAVRRPRAGGSLSPEPDQGDAGAPARPPTRIPTASPVTSRSSRRFRGTPLSLGNRVALLENGPTTYAAMLSAIACGTRPHQHGDLHPRRRRGRPAIRRCLDRQAGGRASRST